MGSVAMVTVMITSAPVTASWTDEQTCTSPATESANFWAFSLVRFQILTSWGQQKGHGCHDCLATDVSASPDTQGKGNPLGQAVLM